MTCVTFFQQWTHMNKQPFHSVFDVPICPTLFASLLLAFRTIFLKFLSLQFPTNFLQAIRISRQPGSQVLNFFHPYSGMIPRLINNIPIIIPRLDDVYCIHLFFQYFKEVGEHWVYHKPLVKRLKKKDKKTKD